MTPPSYAGGGGRAVPPRLLRVTTVPLSLQTLLVGQLSYMQRGGSR
ncbi:MAG TPA: hypothetical protein VMO26_09340 [Vicinamibacterales bacterium]|nr:hypothetical protein [Vicinamibacterales bacterium]